MVRRHKLFVMLILATAAMSLVPVGCTHLDLPTKTSFAVPALPHNGVVLDVFFVRFPAGDPEVNGSVWQEIDELHFAPDVHRRLEANGLRAGVICGSLPLKLEELLQLSEKSPTDPNAPKPIDLDKEPGARQRQLRVRGGKRSNLVVLGERERRNELSVFLRDDEGHVRGRTYYQVMGLFASRAVPQGDGGVRLELTPELEHGKPQQRYVPGDGMFRFEFGSPREVLEQLKLTARLGPGQLLAVSCLPDKPGTVGHQFFTETESDKTVQKMLLVRLVHTEYDDRFSSLPPTAPVDE